MRVSNSFVARLVLLLLSLALAACCCPPNDKTGSSPGGVFNSPEPVAPAAAPSPEVPKEEPVIAPVATILADYANNEVAADAKYKGKIVGTAGYVDDIKKDLFGSVYVTIGTGKQFEIPQIQAFVARDQIQTAATLNKGQGVVVIGRVDGLMMNVLMKECQIKAQP